MFRSRRQTDKKADYRFDGRWPFFALCLALVLFASSAFASPVTWGAEFELTKPGVLAKNFIKALAFKSQEKQLQQEFVMALHERCANGDCVIQQVRGKWDEDFKIVYRDGWWIKISYDPGCVEITFKPSTLDEIRKHADIINEDIFALGRRLGMGVRKDKNSHVNFGIRSAFDSSADFLNFFVDYANHPELALGSLGAKDLRNAPPLAALEPSQRRALTQVLNDAKKSKWTTLKAVVAKIQNAVYTASTEKSWGSPFHYQAVGLKYAAQLLPFLGDKPMELRSVWLQDSAERFVLVGELLEARMRYLKTQAPVLKYTETDRVDFDPVELKTRFAIYVMETGEPFEKYASLLPPKLQDVPLDAFLNPHAPVDEQLKAAARYEDLAVNSQWVRTRLVRIRASVRGGSCRALFTR